MDRPLYYFTYVHRSFGVMVDLLQTQAATLLGDSGSASASQTHEVVASLSADLGHHEFARDVAVHLGDVTVEDHVAFLPISWASANGSHLYPELKGTLELSPLVEHGTPVTQLSLTATYHTPLGVLGRIGNAAAGHRIAEVAVHRFVNDLAARFEDLLPAEQLD